MIFTHRPRVPHSRFSLCWWRLNWMLMTPQWSDNCEAIMCTVISNSLHIDFIQGDIHGRSWVLFAPNVTRHINLRLTWGHLMCPGTNILLGHDDDWIHDQVIIFHQNCINQCALYSSVYWRTDYAQFIQFRSLQDTIWITFEPTCCCILVNFDKIWKESMRSVSFLNIRVLHYPTQLNLYAANEAHEVDNWQMVTENIE